jgi:TonB family protein
MRWVLLLSLSLLYAVTAAGQPSSSTAPPLPVLPKEPGEIFAAAAPLYDFASPTLKPWHMKASYQLYNRYSKNPLMGTYDRWWASAENWRETWKRDGVEYSEWRVRGQRYRQTTGESIKHFESSLPNNLLLSIPSLNRTDGATANFAVKERNSNNEKIPCIQVSFQEKITPTGRYLQYCFSAKHPTVIAFSLPDGEGVIYRNLARTQGMILPRELTVYLGERKTITATVETVEGIAATAAELIPPAELLATKVPGSIGVSSAVILGQLIHRVRPEYPSIDKAERKSGIVVLAAVVGTDGYIHNLEVLDGPSATMEQSALRAVQQWEYKPYLLNGEPVEVDTTINVVFNLGG